MAAVRINTTGELAWNEIVCFESNVHCFCQGTGGGGGGRKDRDKTAIGNGSCTAEDIFRAVKKNPGDFVTQVKQINSQSDLTWMRSFAGPVLPHSQILFLHHFNLRSLYLRFLQSLPNWIQLRTLGTSAICTPFQ